jgi:hypothetical protein
VCDPFGDSSGGQASGAATSTSSQNVTLNLANNIDTSSLASAISALAGTNSDSAELALVGTEFAAKTAAAATVQAAQLQAGLSTSDWILIVIGLAGFLVTAGIIKFKV